METVYDCKGETNINKTFNQWRLFKNISTFECQFKMSDLIVMNRCESK